MHFIPGLLLWSCLLPLLLIFFSPSPGQAAVVSPAPDEFFTSTVDPAHPNLVTSVPYKDCGSKYASLSYLEVDPPCDADVCRIPRGEPVTLFAHVEPTRNLTGLRVQVDRIDQVFGFTTHLLPEFEACERFNVSCPVVENETQYAVVRATFPKSIVPVTLNVKVLIYTDDYDIAMCFISWVELV